MKIQKLEISNFRSFKHFAVEFGDFNVLIGPNAAGKSNFIQVFRFLRDIVSSGLENAISMQGGVEYMRNLSLGSEERFLQCKLEIKPFSGLRAIKETDNCIVGIKPSLFKHEFTLEFTEDSSGYIVAHDKLIQHFDFYSMSGRHSVNGDNKKIGSAELQLINDYGQLEINFLPHDNVPVTKDDLLPNLYMDLQSLADEARLRSSLFIENQYYMPHPESVRKAIGDINIYDLEPNQPKSITSIAGKAELEESGENLAIVLRKILNSAEQSRKLFNLISYVLPFVEDLEVEKFLDKYLQLTVKEKYIPDRFLPASLMSSGSLFIIAIIIVLYFEKKPFSIFEEPARRIHPFLISKVIEMMKESSEHSQILLSTHNPEIVKYSGLDNIFFVSRDEKGFSCIIKPGDKDEIKTFLENEIGLEELFIQNMLG